MFGLKLASVFLLSLAVASLAAPAAEPAPVVDWRREEHDWRREEHDWRREEHDWRREPLDS